VRRDSRKTPLMRQSGVPGLFLQKGGCRNTVTDFSFITSLLFREKKYIPLGTKKWVKTLK
jgi:hypothetical protein